MDVKVTASVAALRPGKPDTKPTTLLDVHEVEWITRELERLLEKERSEGHADADADSDADGGRQRPRKRAEAVVPKKVGFLGRHAVSICSGDAGAGSGRSRRPRGRRSGFREVEEA